MSLTVSKCEQFVAEAPADKVKKHPAGDGLYFVVGRGRAYWSYQFRRGASWSAKGLGGYPEFSPKDARDRLKHWQVTGSLPGEPPRAGSSTPRKATAEVGVPFTEALSQWLAIASQGWRDPRTAAQARAALIKLPLSAEPVGRSTPTWCSAICCGSRRASVKTFGCGLPPCSISPRGKSGGRGTPMRQPGEVRKRTPRHVAQVQEVREPSRRVAWVDLPALMAKLAADNSDASRALMWTILTAVRTGDTAGAKWKRFTATSGQFL